MEELSRLVETYIFGILSLDNNDSDEFAVISFQSNPSRVSRQYALHTGLVELMYLLASPSKAITCIY